MLKIERKLNERVTVVVEGETQLDLFEQLSTMEEVFGEESCKKCKKNGKAGTNISFRVRNVVDGKKTHKYPELVCKDCYAKFTFGMSEGGSVFPVRFERKEGEYVMKDGKRIEKGTKGWVIYNKETGKEE